MTGAGPGRAAAGLASVVGPLLLLLAAERGLRVAESQPAGRDASPVAALLDEVVTPAELSAYWYERYRETWYRTLLGLVDERLVRREARRLGVRVPEAALVRAVDAEVEARAAQLRAAFGEEADLAAEVRRTYGLSVEAWRREILAPRLEMQQLLARIVRLDTRRRLRLKVRVIVLESSDAAERVLGKLRGGADFSLTALQESVDPTARTGGDLPEIAQGDLAWPAVEARLWEAAPGALVGPLSVDQDGRRTFHVYRVVRRVEPWTGERAEVFRRLEEDLRERPLDLPEFERWRARTHRDFRVRLFDPSGRPVTAPALESGR